MNTEPQDWPRYPPKRVLLFIVVLQQWGQRKIHEGYGIITSTGGSATSGCVKSHICTENKLYRTSKLENKEANLKNLGFSHSLTQKSGRYPYQRACRDISSGGAISLIFNSIFKIHFYQVMARFSTENNLNIVKHIIMIIYMSMKTNISDYILNIKTSC